MEICDFCKSEKKEERAVYDGKTVFGYWAFMCDKHFTVFGSGLGLGFGQKIKKLEGSVINELQKS